jgi:hypothetical protein
MKISTHAANAVRRLLPGSPIAKYQRATTADQFYGSPVHNKWTNTNRSLVTIIAWMVALYPTCCPAQVSSVSTSGYPVNAQYVPVASRASLQTQLNTFKVIRLDANADYTASGGIKQLTISSNEKVYGLPGTNVPPIVVSAGTQMAVLSHLQTDTVTFPTSSTSTHDNLFVSIQSGAVATGATLEQNLFVDWNGSLALNDSSSGHFRNNRFIRTLDHSNDNPYLQLEGNMGNASYGNVFLWYNFLTPHGDSTNISGLTDVTFVGVDAESWDYNGAGSNAVITTASNVGTLRFFAANGGDNVHTPSDPAATGYFDIGGGNFLLFNDVATSQHNPKVKLETGVVTATMLNVDSQDAGNGLQVVNRGTFVYGDGSGSVPGSLTTGQQASLRSSIIPGTRTGSPWEAPIYDPVPDPGGPNWNAGLAGKPDSTAMIQRLINAATNGPAFLPTGTYYISSPLTMTSSQGLVGAGMGQTLIIAKSAIDMIVGADHFNSPLTQAGLTLSDLTLQGGANGIHHEPNGSGGGAQYNLIFLSHVTFRNMSKAGIYIDSISAWDNNLIDHVNFINNGTGILQRVSPSWAGGDTDGESYLDKNVFYKCQFIGNGIAVNLPAHRINNLNAWVENLFDSNKNGAFQMTDNSSPVIANSDFNNNGGSAVLVNDNNTVNLVGCRFSAGTAGRAMLKGTFSTEGSNFQQPSGGVSTIVSSASTGSADFYNSNSQNMPLGTLGYGYFFNDQMYGSPNYSLGGTVLTNGTTSIVLPGATTGIPIPQLLFGAALQIRY